MLSTELAVVHSLVSGDRPRERTPAIDEGLRERHAVRTFRSSDARKWTRL